MRLTLTLFCLLLAGAPRGISQTGLDTSNQDSRTTGTTRSIEGIVTDAGGTPVKGAVVQIKDTKTLQVRSFIAADDGAYHFYGLSGDVSYEIHAAHQGAISATKTISIYDSHKKTTLNLKLKG